VPPLVVLVYTSGQIATVLEVFGMNNLVDESKTLVFIFGNNGGIKTASTTIYIGCDIVHNCGCKPVPTLRFEEKNEIEVFCGLESTLQGAAASSRIGASIVEQ
jgi:hypothetical protein